MPSIKYGKVNGPILLNLRKTLGLIVTDARKCELKVSEDICKLNSSSRKLRTIGNEFQLISKCITSHRFEDACKLLSVSCIDAFDVLLFRAAMLILENVRNEETNPNVRNFMSTIRKFRYMNKNEVTIEHLMFCLKNNVPDLKAEIKDTHITSGKLQSLKKDSTIDPLLNGYLGLVCYVDWHKIHIEDRTDMSRAEISASNAINHFKSCLEKPGQWDIFLLKLIEILQYYGKYEEIETTLTQYIHSNPKHINGYIYLCSFLEEISPNSKSLIKHLKKLAKLSPSDTRILLLINKWKTKARKIKQCIKLLFSFLDYPTNGGNVQAWELLYEVLTQKVTKKKHWSDALEQWNKRCSIWLHIHFDISAISLMDEQLIELIKYKAHVCLLFQKDNEYSEAVFTIMPSLGKRPKKQRSIKEEVMDEIT